MNRKLKTTPRLRRAKKLLCEAICDWGECHPEFAWRKFRLIQRRLRTVCEIAFDIGAGNGKDNVP